MSNKERENKDNNNNKNNIFCDILSIPSNPEDLFTLLYKIGQGAFGSVFKAIHNSTKKIYAIKIIDYSKNNNRKNNMIINYNYQSIQQETSLMKLVSYSKYVVKYYGSYFSRKSNTLWLILEYCATGSVIDLMLSMGRTFSEEEVSSIMEMVLKGLVELHKNNLIHRDIKGANILLSEDGTAKIADFGVGVHLINEKNRSSKKGSPYWMSPQVALNSDYDVKTDIWSFGITCLELINGEPPFSELKPRCVIEKMAKSPPLVKDLIDFDEHTDEFIDFLKKCLEINPIKRPSAQELLKHPFIVNFSKGRQKVSNLIKKHLKDVENFRLQSLNNNNKNGIGENTELYINNEEEEENLININKNDCLTDIINKSKTYQIFSKKNNNNTTINYNNNDTTTSKVNNDLNTSSINIRNETKKDNNEENEEEEKDNKFQTLIIYDKEEKQNTKEKKDKLNFINYIEKDKFIFDDLKYLEIMAKENLKDNTFNTENNISNKEIKNDNTIKINIKKNNEKNEENPNKNSSDYTYIKPQLTSYFRNKNKKFSNSVSQLKKDDKNYLAKNDSLKIYEEVLLKDNSDDLINYNKPIKIKYHENNISSINNKNERKDEENVDDSDDEFVNKNPNATHNYFYKIIHNYE